ncbi:MAG: class I tRNA ligase family protein, partial [Psychrilyobacter sp.]|nr:class I tRNA ligase family protein [Psychrilyobacter sp.]
EWNENGLAGASRFLNRVWRMVMENKEYIELGTIDLEKASKVDKNIVMKLHQTIKKVTNSIEDNYHFNTSIAANMELINELQDFKTNILEKGELSTESKKVFGETIKTMIVMLSPFVPHITAELWAELGEKGHISEIEWPSHVEELTISDDVQIGVQVNGKLRATLDVSRTITKEELEALALEAPNVLKFIEGKNIVKKIVVPGRIVNIVVK